MKPSFFIVQLFTLITASALAQVDVLVRDRNSGAGVEGVVVFASGSRGEIIAQSVSDKSGKVSMNVLSYPVMVSTSHISYKPVQLEVESAGEVVIGLDASLTELEAIVVTGQYEPQSAQQSVYRVRTLSSERIQAVGSTRLQDVLNTELNIRFSQDLALGGSNLSMQGLSGQNVKVLIDGVPMVGRQGTGNEININQININSIERIEIVEGPMSVIYGADALAGVINIITRKPDEGKWSSTVRLHEESAGGEYGIGKGIHNESLSLGYAKNSFYALADVTRNFFGGWQGSAEDRDKEWHPKTQYLGSGVTGYRKNDLDIYYRLDYLYENIYNPGLFSGIEALDQRYITNRFMHQVQATASLGERLKYNGAISFTDYSRKIQTVTVNKDTGDERLALGPGLQDLTQFDGFTIRGTFLHKTSTAFSLQSGYDVNIETGSGGRLKEGTSSIEDYALFLSAEVKPLWWLSARPGLRFIRNSAYEAPPVVPSLNVKVMMGTNHDLRISYGRGFRAPSLRELYFNFFDASHSIEGNPNLLAELSHSYNVAFTARLANAPGFSYTTTVAGFYNRVSNMIGYGVKPGNTNITTYINIDEFRSQGFTWTNSVQYRNIEASAGMGYTGRYSQLSDPNGSSADYAWSPEANASVTWKVPSIGSCFAFYYKFTGRTPFYAADVDGSVTLNETEGFQWADISLQKSLKKYFTLSAGVRNLFDVTRINNMAANGGPIHGSGSTQPIGYGRSYFASITFKI